MLAISHCGVLNSTVYAAYSKAGKAGRVVSGLLKAAVKRGDIEVLHRQGRVTGTSYYYKMTEAQLIAIRAEAIRRGDAPLRQQLCTPMTVGEAAIAASTVR